MPKKVPKKILNKIKWSENRDLRTVTQLWGDGGLIQGNPSNVGGTWAYCLVNAEDEIVHGDSDVVPLRNGGEISNNTTEIIAIIKGLEMLPGGWSGTIFTDSWVTITRFAKIARYKADKIKDIPHQVQARAINAYHNAGVVDFKLVKGHPRQIDLDVGYYKGDADKPMCERRVVSKFNVWCDNECTKRGEEYLKELQGVK